MNQNLLAILKHPLLFVGSIIGAVLCLLLGIYYALPGVYHVSLGHDHPPLDPKLPRDVQRDYGKKASWISQPTSTVNALWLSIS